jgi:hypothetical protein
MSSTNRSNARSSHISDYYVTPLQLIKEFLEEWLKENTNMSLDTTFLDCCSGGVARGGYVVMLLRLNFLESKARKQFFENNMPERIYVHHKRMSFTDDGKTDSVAYMHAVWKQGTNLSKSILKII